jgi:hypothetical protein
VTLPSVAADPTWKHESFTPLETSVVLFAGVIGVLILGLQPVLLGALVDEHRLSLPELGEVATLELLTMAAAASLAGARLRPERLRLVAVLAGLGLAVCDAATIRCHGSGILALRALAGIPSGILMWITAGMITRSALPHRWSAVYLTVQTLAQFICSTAFSESVIPRFGVNGALLVLAALGASTALTAPLLPRRYLPLPHVAGSTPRTSGRGLAALGAIVIYMAFIQGVWVYMEPLAHQLGFSARVAGIAASVCLGMQVVGGAAATWFAGRLRYFPTFVVVSAFNLAILGLLASHPGTAIFLAGWALYGLLWLFVMPFQVPLTIEADPTRRAAMQIVSAGLLGSSLGPWLASLLVSETDAQGGLALGASWVVGSLIIVAWLHLTRHPKVQAA